jgi:cation:H+ antiporter
MFQNIVLLAVGFIILVKGADVFVESACNVAQILRVPVVIIGIIIIGFGTSLPELAVNLNAVFKGDNAIAIGNVIGSNVFNILFIVGTIAIFKTIHIKKKMLRFEFPFLLLASAILLFFCLDCFVLDTQNTLSRFDGIILLCVFVFFLYRVFKTSAARKGHDDEVLDFHVTKDEELKVGGNSLSVVTGLILVIYGGNMVVDQSVKIASLLGLSHHFIGLTVVGIGTSLPEYITSIIALLKGKQDIIVGNIIGSNIFNILLILGVSSLVLPLAVTNPMVIDASVCFSSAALVALIAFWKGKVTRTTGIILTLIYLSYFAYIIFTR